VIAFCKNETCKKEFKTKPSRIKKGFGKYCSQKCYFECIAIKQRKNDIKNGLIRKCIVCNNEFKTRKKDIANGHGICCSRSCAKKCFHILNPNIYLGEKSKFWKGGITPIRKEIKNLREYKVWSKSVLERDKYTCQECGNVGGILAAHHIKEFYIIFNEFLIYYNQFSPIEDKETLVRLAITYKPFWEIDNGKTFCKDCHSKTESYLNKSLCKKK